MSSYPPLLNQRNFRVLVTLFVPLALSQCAKEEPTGAPPIPTSPSNTNSYAEILSDSNDLTQSEETELINKAKTGDPSSAFRLSRFYSSTKKWNWEAIRWLVVSAENGNEVAAFNLGMYYQLPQPTANLERSHYWLKIAKERGYSQAVDELKRLEKLLNEPNPPDEASNGNQPPGSEAPPPGK